MMRRLRLACIGAFALALWSFLASALALYQAGSLHLLGRWWWWDFLPYLLHPGVLRIVVLSGSIALFVAAGVSGIGLLSDPALLRGERPRLYGSTNWASREELGQGGFREGRRPD